MVAGYWILLQELLTCLKPLPMRSKTKSPSLQTVGVRSGGDVLKLLALGADAVMIGRPISVAAVGGLQQGVESYLSKIKGELIQSMVLTGTTSTSMVSKDILHA